MSFPFRFDTMSGEREMQSVRENVGDDYGLQVLVVQEVLVVQAHTGTGKGRAGG